MKIYLYICTRTYMRKIKTQKSQLYFGEAKKKKITYLSADWRFSNTHNTKSPPQLLHIYCMHVKFNFNNHKKNNNNLNFFDADDDDDPKWSIKYEFWGN